MKKMIFFLCLIVFTNSWANSAKTNNGNKPSSDLADKIEVAPFNDRQEELKEEYLAARENYLKRTGKKINDIAKADMNASCFGGPGF